MSTKTAKKVQSLRRKLEANCISAVILQRVKSASVTVDGEIVSTIGKGILALAAVDRNDTIKDAEKTASKLLSMKLWDDENGGRVCLYFRTNCMEWA